MVPHSTRKGDQGIFDVVEDDDIIDFDGCDDLLSPPVLVWLANITLHSGPARKVDNGIIDANHPTEYPSKPLDRK